MSFCCRPWASLPKKVHRRGLVCGPLIGLAGVAFLVFLGLPFLSVKWGFPDDRVLPASASAHRVGDQMRDDFVINSETAVTIVVPDTHDITGTEIEQYATALSRVPDVSAVSTP